MAQYTDKYGVKWNATPQKIDVEFHQIKRGAKKLEELGRSLFFHYRAAFSILWPQDDHNRWSDLILKTYCENEITVLMGCSDSCKTYTMSKIALVDYWCFPNDTLSLVSTTEGRGAELRIWGCIKDLFNQARNAGHEIAGNPIDYLKTITTDSVDEDRETARSIRRGLVVVPCFPSGTLVDTLNGKTPIENIKVGDVVLNACGIGKVKETHSRIASTLVRVHLSDGRFIDCTEEHPFFTNHGWTSAIDLKPYDVVLSSHETMRLLQKGISLKTTYPKVLLGGLPNLCSSETMRAMRKDFSATQSDEKQKSQREVLQHNLRGEICGRKKADEADQFSLPNLQKTDAEHSLQSEVLFGEVPEQSNPNAMRAMWSWVHVNPSLSRKTKESILRGILQEELEWPMVGASSNNSNSRGTNGVGIISSGGCSASYTDGSSEIEQRKTLVSNRRSVSRNQAGGRSGWRGASNSSKRAARQGSNKILGGAWVDSVEVLESRSDERFIQSKGGYRVHNLEVEGHPSYSVNGVVVHNCKTGGVTSGLAPYIGIKAKRFRHFGDEIAVMSDAFLNAYANWYGKEDFKGVMSGNFMETDDPLGRAAEPADGWDSFVDTEKTQTWRGKFYDACVVALDGRDSPNFDFPSDQPTKFPYLIGKKKLDGIAKTNGKDSWEWYSQCCGKPVKGMDIWRVLSKDFCRKHHASDELIWDGTQTKIYAVDPAYGGGDRCVGRKIEFGRVVSGDIHLKVFPPEIIPISIKSQTEPEDQIAAFVKNRLTQLGIPVENCFYDSFGRGTLGFSFAKVFGAKCPIPIDSGMKPTTRPVRFDLFIEEGNGKKRLKRCDEHYTKFITELWFSVRETIECEQIRNLDAETIAEGCARKFTKNSSAKLEVEPKDDMKERLGKSPDFFDCLAIAVEGARQRGFKIKRNGTELVSKPKTDWLDMRSKEFQELQKKRQLTTA